jgi:hypothetical protein
VKVPVGTASEIKRLGNQLPGWLQPFTSSHPTKKVAQIAFKKAYGKNQRINISILADPMGYAWLHTK